MTEPILYCSNCGAESPRIEPHGSIINLVTAPGEGPRQTWWCRKCRHPFDLPIRSTDVFAIALNEVLT